MIVRITFCGDEEGDSFELTGKDWWAIYEWVANTFYASFSMEVIG